MNIVFLTDAVKNLLPDNTPFHVTEATYSGIEILDDTELPSEEAVLAEYAVVEQQHTDTEYQRLREPAYPSIGDQLDALFKAGVFPDDMAAKIQSVKDQYPKPSSES